MFVHMPNLPRLIGSAQAAKIFDVDRATFNRWVKAGRVPVAVEMDGETGARLFDPAVIAQLADERAAEKGRDTVGAA